MCKKKVCCIIVGLSAMLPASAQYSQNQVAVLDADAITSVFSAEGIGQNRNEALENARMATLYKLMYEGIEGFNNNAPVVASPDYQRTNIWLRDFFVGKYAAYKGFLGEVELVGDFEQRSPNEFRCFANVVVKHGMLFRQADTQGITRQQGQQPPQQSAPAEQGASKSGTEPQVQPVKKKKIFL